MNREKTFIKISNKDLYNELKKLEEDSRTRHEENKAQIEKVISRQDKTNGRVSLSQWIGTTALSLVIIGIGLFFQHLAK